MKKSFLLLGLTSILGVAGLASCGGNDKPTNKTVLDRKETLSMQAATSLSMLNQGTTAKALRMAKKMAADATITDAEKAEITKILPTLDLMLENSSTFDSTIKTGTFKPLAGNEELVFNVEEMITFKDTDGKDVSYYLYYTDPKATPAPDTGKPDTDAGTPETDTGKPDTDAGTPETDTGKPDTDAGTPDAGTPETGTSDKLEPTGPKAAAETLEEDDEEDEETEDEEAGKVEVEESINGLATTDKETFYNFTSKVEKETSNEETEEERTFKIETNETSYIEVKQEHEVEGNEIETEFKYKIVDNGKISLEYSIEIEKEDNQTELGYEIDGKEYELRKEVVKEEGVDVTYYHVEYENDKTDVEALIKFKKVTKENGEVEYEIVA